MKNVKLSDFEIYLINESLKNYKIPLSKQEFPPNSIVTKEYISMMVTQVEEKLNDVPLKSYAITKLR